MFPSLFEQGETHFRNGRFEKALECYVKIWADKIYLKTSLSISRDEIRCLSQVDGKFVVGSRDGHIYALDTNLEVCKQTDAVGKLKSLNTCQFNGEHYLLAVAGSENIAASPRLKSSPRAIGGEKRKKGRKVLLYDKNIELLKQIDFTLKNDCIFSANFLEYEGAACICIGTARGKLLLYDLSGSKISNDIDGLDNSVANNINLIEGMDFESGGNHRIVATSHNNLYVFGTDGVIDFNIKTAAYITDICMAQRTENSPPEGVFFVTDASEAWFLEKESGLCRKIFATNGSLFCIRQFDIDGDKKNELVVGSSVNAIYVLNPDGALLSQIKTDNEVRDLLATGAGGAEKEALVLAGMGNGKVHIYGCPSRRFIADKIQSCFQMLDWGDDIGILDRLAGYDSQKYDFFHQFVAEEVKKHISKDPMGSMKVIGEIAERKPSASTVKRILPTIEIMVESQFEKVKAFWSVLMEHPDIQVKQALFEAMSFLIPRLSAPEATSEIIALVSKMDKVLKKKPEVDLWGEIENALKNKRYGAALKHVQRLEERKLDLVFAPFQSSGKNSIPKIYIADIDDDQFPEILFRTKDGYLHCLNILGEEKWEYNTEDTTSSLSASRILGRRTKLGEDGTVEPKEVIWGTAKGEVAMLNEDGRLIFKEKIVDSPVNTIASVGDSSLRVGLKNGQVVSYNYYSENLLINDQWYFKAGNHVSSIFYHDLDKDGIGEFVVGSKDKNVYILKYNGELICGERCSDSIVTLCVTDKNPEKCEFVYACCRDGKVNVFRYAKDRLEKVKILHLGCSFASVYHICDIDQDGNVEILSASEGTLLNVHDCEGKSLGQFEFDDCVASLGFISHDLYDRPNIVVGFSTGVVACYRTFRSGELENLSQRCKNAIDSRRNGFDRAIRNVFAYHGPLAFESREHQAIFIPNAKLVKNDPDLTLLLHRWESKEYFSLIHGECKTGKTSLLNYMASRLGSRERIVFIAEIEKMNRKNLSGFFFDFAVSLYTFLFERKIILAFRYKEEDFEKNAYNVMGAFFDDIFQMLNYQRKRLCIFYDNIDRLIDTDFGKEACPFFYRRGKSNHILSVFSSSVPPETLDIGLNFQQMAAWDCDVSKFDIEQIASVLHAQKEISIDTKDLPSLIYELTEGNPFLVQLAAHVIVKECVGRKKDSFQAEDIDELFIESLVPEAESYCETKWRMADQNQRMLLSMAATYFDWGSPVVLKEVANKAPYSKALIKRIKTGRETIVAEGSIYMRWVRRTWPFPIYVLNEMASFAKDIPLGAFHYLNEELAQRYPIKQIREAFDERIDLERYTWRRVSAVSEAWDALLKNKGSKEAACLQFIRQIVLHSDFSFLSDQKEIFIHGNLYFSCVRIDKMTVLSEKVYLCVVPENAKGDEVRKNIEGIRSKGGTQTNLVFAFFESEPPYLENLKQHVRWSVVITEKDLKALLFSKSELSDAMWDVALEQIDISVFSPYSTTTVASLTFVGRDREIDQITQKKNDSNYALIGGRLIGKSSLIHCLVNIFGRNPNCVVLHVNCDPIFPDREGDDLHQKLVAEINANYSLGLSSIHDFFDHLISVKRSRGKKHIVFLDEIDSFMEYDKANNFKFFRNMRSLSEKRICSIIVAGYRKLFESTLEKDTPLLRLLKDLRLDFLDENSARNLIEIPFADLRIRFPEKKSKRLVDKILEFTGRHPCYIQKFCERTVEILSEQKRRIFDEAFFEEVKNDPELLSFIDRSFLEGRVITKFEKIVVLGLIEKGISFSFSQIFDIVSGLEIGIDFSCSVLERALENLCLANIIEKTGFQKYTIKNPVLFRKLASYHRIEEIAGEGDCYGY